MEMSRNTMNHYIKTKDMSYTLQYIDRKGRHHTMMRADENISDISNRMKQLCAQKIEAKAYHNGEVVGQVREDLTQRIGFNWYIEDGK